MLPKSISVLLPDLRGGGAERVSLDLAFGFANAGYEVQMVLMQARGEFLSEASSHFTVVDLATQHARFLPIALLRYLKRHKPDFLLASIWPLTAVAPFASFLSAHRCKVIVTEHNSLSLQYSNWGRAHRTALRLSMTVGYRFANCRVGVSKGVTQDMAALSGLSFDKFATVYNPIKESPVPSKKAILDAESLWDCPRGGRILTVGSMKPQKNHSLLLHAFALLDRPQSKLMIVGDGVERKKLLLLAKELKIDDRVILTGFRSEPTPFYKTTDLFVLSSNYEGFGNVIVEALACGIPVVSTDCRSGPSEILDNGRFGQLVPVGNVSALADAMNAALEKPVDRDELKNRAAHFAPSIAVQRYIDLMNE